MNKEFRPILRNLWKCAIVLLLGVAILWGGWKADAYLYGAAGLGFDKDIESQLQVLAANRELFVYDESEWGDMTAGYAVYDMDRDGRLELITSICAGSGIYSYNYFYQINETKDGMAELGKSYYAGKQEWDIDNDYNEPIQAYEENGRIYYPASDYMRDGQSCGCNEGAYYLEENTVVSVAYRTWEEYYSDEEQQIETYYSADGITEISEEEWEQCREKFWEGKTETEALIYFQYATPEQINSMTEEELYYWLAESYVNGK